MASKEQCLTDQLSQALLAEPLNDDQDTNNSQSLIQENTSQPEILACPVPQVIPNSLSSSLQIEESQTCITASQKEVEPSPLLSCTGTEEILNPFSSCTASEEILDPLSSCIPSDEVPDPSSSCIASDEVSDPLSSCLTGDEIVVPLPSCIAGDEISIPFTASEEFPDPSSLCITSEEIPDPLSSCIAIDESTDLLPSCKANDEIRGPLSSHEVRDKIPGSCIASNDEPNLASSLIVKEISNVLPQKTEVLEPLSCCLKDEVPSPGFSCTVTKEPISPSLSSCTSFPPNSSTCPLPDSFSSASSESDHHSFSANSNLTLQEAGSTDDDNLVDPNCNEIVLKNDSCSWGECTTTDQGEEPVIVSENTLESPGSSKGTEEVCTVCDEIVKEILKPLKHSVLESAPRQDSDNVKPHPSLPFDGSPEEEVFSREGRCEETAVISNIPPSNFDPQTKNLNVISITNTSSISTFSSQNLLETKDISVNPSCNLSVINNETIGTCRNLIAGEDVKCCGPTDDWVTPNRSDNSQDSVPPIQEITTRDEQISRQDESNKNILSSKETVISEGNNSSGNPLEVSNNCEKKLDLVIDVSKKSNNTHLGCVIPIEDHGKLASKSGAAILDIEWPHEQNLNSAKILSVQASESETKLDNASSNLPLSPQALVPNQHQKLDKENNTVPLSESEHLNRKIEEQEVSFTEHVTSKKRSDVELHSQDYSNDMLLNFETKSSNTVSGNIMALEKSYLPAITLGSGHEGAFDKTKNSILNLVDRAKSFIPCPEKYDSGPRKSSCEQVPCLLPPLKSDKGVELRRTSILSEATLPTISEKVPVEEESPKKVVLPSEFNLQNSPMLRNSRACGEKRTRRDCRFLFSGDSASPSDNEESPEMKNHFQSLRDSLDIAKHVQLFSEDKDGDDEVKEDLPTQSLASSIEPATEPTTKPPEERPRDRPHYAGKSMSDKKKVSLKNNREGALRRVSFPEDDSRLITSYLEPVNPWFHMNNVSTSDIAEAYKKSCDRHHTRALPTVLQQIVALPVGVGGRIECLSMRNSKLEAGQCECLEEVFRRVQFQTLDLEGCELEDDTAIPLFDMIEFYDSAIHLNISGNGKIGNRGWHACARMMKRTQSLRTLEARATNLSEQNMPIVCKALKLGTRLHTLHLENCNLTGRPLVTLAGVLRVNDTVTDLFLADNRLGANDSIQLGNLVRANRTLRLLDLRNNNIQDTGCAHICKDIAEQQTLELSREGGGGSGLTTLVLWNNHITVHSIPYFSLMLHANSTLETLNLGRNNITSEGVLLLKSSLIRNRCLKRVGLQASRIGNEGAVALAECLADNGVIERIDLRENNIQVAGLLALCRSLKMNSTVVQLDLDANPRAEPTADLNEQHLTLYQEIKSLCQKNQTRAHLRSATEVKKKGQEEGDGNKADSKCDLLVSPEKRKISLTCDTTSHPQLARHAFLPNEAPPLLVAKRYFSPAPSPSVSPCPSPSPSPSPSPMPSPLKNRFRVMKVYEDAGGSPALSTSAPVFFSHSAMGGSLPSLMPSAVPNRFAGRRFTVTKVNEAPPPPFSLPASRAMSSPSLIAPMEEGGAPTIVVSSPNKAVRGFSVDFSDADDPHKPDCFPEKGRSNSVDFPVLRAQGGAESPSETVFTPPPEIQRAPLAAMEAGSFDSDSEDSELTTQSSDSTHSDEVRIATELEASKPLAAWETQGEECKKI